MKNLIESFGLEIDYSNGDTTLLCLREFSTKNLVKLSSVDKMKIRQSYEVIKRITEANNQRIFDQFKDSSL